MCGSSGGEDTSWAERRRAEGRAKQKVATKYAGSYYGSVASKSHQAYLDSNGEKLADAR